MNLGQTIRGIRHRKNMKQCELAKLAGISITALVEIEKGKVFPTQETINRICKALGISKGCLLVHSLDESELPPQKSLLYQYLVKPLQEELWEEQQ